ncbi:MAG: hypothetical protein AAF430_22800 [Myxococcota bacterium]
MRLRILIALFSILTPAVGHANASIQEPQIGKDPLVLRAIESDATPAPARQTRSYSIPFLTDQLGIEWKPVRDLDERELLAECRHAPVTHGLACQ